MTLSTFMQQMVNGISLGSMYALIAIGYTMVYGILRLINFAHGDIMMVGAFIAYFANANGVPFLFGGIPRAFPTPIYLTKIIHIGGVVMPISVFIIPVVTLLILAVILWILYKTKYGMAIRALAFDIPTVKLMGINADFIIMIVFAIGSGLAAIGGVFYAVSYPSIDPLMGIIVGLKAFAAAVLGGIGSVGGAVIGGFILGFTEIVVVAFMPDLGGYKDAFAFVFLILVLLFKPTGIMGQDLERSRF